MPKALFPTTLRTRRTVIRRMRTDDAQAWKSFNNAIAKRMPWPHVPSVVYARNEMLHYDTSWDAGSEQYYSVVERSTGKVIGDFHLKSIDRKRRRVEFGHALHPRVWGTGITYEILDAFRRATAKASYTMWCRTEEGNIRSWKSLEKYGALYSGTRTAKLGKERKRLRYYELLL